MKVLKQNNIEEILHGSLFKAILSLAIPVVINSFLQTMYNLTDTYWLGKIGTEQLAAINLVTPLQNIIINFGSGITVAGAVLIAQYIGAGEKEDARSMANQIFLCAMIFGVACSTLCFIATPGIVGWLGAEGETFAHSVTFLRVVIWDMPFLFMVNIFQSVHQAQGNTLKPMLLNLCGISINMILDPLFMMVFHMGVAGAALATLTAKAVPAVIAFCILCSPKSDLRLHRSYMKIQAEKLKMILQIGLPTAIGGSAMQFGFLLMSRNVFEYGTQAMAAYGIGNRVNGLITLPSNGIGSATATIVGQNMGAKQQDRAEQGYKISMKICVTFLFIGGMILSRDAISTAIVSIFSDDPEVIAMAADFLSIMAFWCFTNGVYNSSTGLFQGTGHTEVTMAVDATRLWVFRFLTLWFCETILHMGVRSVWYSVVVSNGICSVILYCLYRAGIWKKVKIKIGKKDKENAAEIREQKA
ncbi:MAG: MATE family efflux transporter [Lachnospiraceae bacterium]|nr:MATE family efflux transporter [Lachnospiraceae bacterium]